MGKIELDHTGSGAGITLSSDGTSLLLDGTAIGGGGGAALELYAENPSSPTAPSATGTNAVAIGNAASATNAETTAVGKQALASGSNAAAFGHRATASGSYSVAAGSWCTASAVGSAALGGSGLASGAVVAGASWSTAIGLNSNALGSQTATGSGAMALGGSRASGADSFAAAIANNTSTYGATGANSVAIGELAKATGANSFACGNSAIASSAHGVAIGDRAEATGTQYSVAIGGDNPEATDQYTVVIGGYVNRVSNDYSAIVGGYSNNVSGQRSFVGAGRENSISSSYSAAFGFRVNSRADYSLTLGSDQFNVSGGSQVGRYILSCATTDATLKQMTSGGAAAASKTFFQIPDASAATFSGLIVGRQQNSSSTDCVAFRIEGLLVRGTGAGTTSLVNSATTVIDNTPAWGGVTLSANTTLGGLKIEVTGAAATNIRWVCNLDTSEVIYA
jgi:trimeric autotransporter adhesin